MPTNLVDAEQVAALVDGTVDAYGRLDGLVNNAFRMDTFETFDAVDLVKWRKIFEVNVWGTLVAHAGVRPAPEEGRQPSTATRRSCSSSR